jgi:hypothetical protein
MHAPIIIIIIIIIMFTLPAQASQWAASVGCISQLSVSHLSKYSVNHSNE